MARNRLRTATFDGPAFLATALINGDSSGFGEGDQAAHDYLMAWLRREYGDHAHVVDVGEEATFRRNMSRGVPYDMPGAGAASNLWLGGDSVEYTVLYRG